MKKITIIVLVSVFVLILILVVAVFYFRHTSPKLDATTPGGSTQNTATQNTATSSEEKSVASDEKGLKPPISTKKHIPTPKVVRAIYMTSWVASQHDWRAKLAQFIKDSDLNSVVIDVKDYSGVISFKTGDDVLAAGGAEQVRVQDMEEFIATLHEMGIYVIARISVFQDPIYAVKHPEQAVQNGAGAVWTDKHGLHFVDPAASDYWNYIIRLSKASISIGFDELNFDYMRYPTDGNLKDIRYPISGPELKKLDVSLKESRPTGSILPTAKQVVLTRFFKTLSEQLRPLGIPLSVDFFGMTLTAKDDVNIGQVLEAGLPYFDYICPMIYPSHYPRQFNGYANPAEHPYEVIHFVMKAGVERVKAAGYKPSVLRPWLQDFNMGAVYDTQKVRAQIQGTHDAGVHSWLIWDPRNKYTRPAYSGWDKIETRSTENEKMADKTSL